MLDSSGYTRSISEKENHSIYLERPCRHSKFVRRRVTGYLGFALVVSYMYESVSLK
jgi:hypothetical protein